MAVVPNCQRATVSPEKITDYLLSERHPVGAPKARFFLQFGFGKEAPDDLIGSLLTHVRRNPIAAVEKGLYGTKYRVDGPLPSPDGRNPVVSTVWIVPVEDETPRFVTAFPC
jgi:hypothetical protein